MDFRTSDSGLVKERNQVDPDLIKGDDEQLVFAATEALGLRTPLPPKYTSYDHVVILGGLVRANIWRPAYAAHLLREDIATDGVTAISAFRPLAQNPDDPDKDEYKLLDVFDLPQRRFEWEVMEDGLRRAFDLPEFTVQMQSAADAQDGDRFRVASAESARQRVNLVVAPSYESGRRANTADGYRYWADQIGHVKNGDRVLAVTTCIYLPYQHAVAIQLLGLPFGCSIDTVGVDTRIVDDSISPQIFRGVHYLQETRSAIRGYRQLVARLEAEKSGTGQ